MTEQIPSPGVVRASAAAHRKELEALQRKLKQAEDKLATVSAEARVLAAYIQSRGGATMWHHQDVLNLITLFSTGVGVTILGKLANAEERKLPPSHVLFKRLVSSEFESAGVKTAQYVGTDTAPGAGLATNLTTSMRTDLLKVLERFSKPVNTDTPHDT